MRVPTYRRGADHGAVAVEFALLLPILMLLIFGLIDFGRALNAQITLNQAARNGARLAAMGRADAATRTRTAAIGLSGLSVYVQYCAPGAGPGASAMVRASYPFAFATPVGAVAALFGQSGFAGGLTLTAEAVMPCET